MCIRRLGVLLVLFLPLNHVHGQSYDFSWDRATVYTIATDYFFNGDPANDDLAVSSLTDQGLRDGVGGDFSGITAKIKDGYFGRLGISAISISNVFPSAEAGTEFASIWSSDYFRIAEAYGTENDFKELIEAAHEENLRVILEVGVESDPVDLAIDSTDASAIPVMSSLFSSETATAGLADYFSRSAYPVRSDYAQIKWLSDWIGNFGIDGFRITNTSELEEAVVSAVKAEGLAALNRWKDANPSASMGSHDFWLLADLANQGIEKSTLSEAGVDAVVNSEYVGHVTGLDEIYTSYSEALAADPTFNAVSFVSSEEAKLQEKDELLVAGSEMFLLPGSIQVFYGDETARQASASGAHSPMNWDDLDQDVLDHWSKMGQFRANHPAIAAGVHEKISDEPYAFYRGIRIGQAVDEVIVVMAAPGRVQLNIRKYFPDDIILRDAYSGKISMVSYGEVAFDVGESGILLLEPVK